MLPTYRQSQLHTFSCTALLSGSEGTASLLIADKIFLVENCHPKFSYFVAIIYRGVDEFLKLKRSVIDL